MMLLWLVFALLSAGVLAVLVRPLLITAQTAAPHAGGPSAVYRDQLTELDADLKAGQISAEEAEAARREIARRLLSAEAESGSPPQSAAPAAETVTGLANASRTAARLAVSIGLLMPAAAVAIYATTGHPSLHGQPFAARSPQPRINPDIAKLVTAVEARLKTNPEDGRGWDVIAPVYLRLARYAEAANAFERAGRLLGDSPARLSGFAEAVMMANEGRVTDAARVALEKLLRLEPDNIQAKFWLAFAKEQQGRLAEAAAEYEQLLAVAPPDAPWREALAERHESVRSALTQNVAPALPRSPETSSPAPSTAPGPSQADIAAAERMSASERQAMIDAMVAGLASRLEKDGRDLAGWQRLIRALNTLGRKDEAIAALDRARKSFEGQAEPLAELSELSRTLGLGS